MAANKTRARQGNRPYDLADIRVLAKMLAQYQLTEVEVELEGQRVRLRREPPAAAPAAAEMLPPPPRQTLQPPPAAVAPVEPADDGTVVISSPFVGTFYRAPAPEAASFVDLGQNVKKGQVLCIVEAMKLMNEIEADLDCRIVEVLAKNAEAVEFGQPLFRVSPLA